MKNNILNMLSIYLWIGMVVGLIFAAACVFLYICNREDFNDIVNKRRNSAIGNDMIALAALIIHIVFWPIIIAFLGRMIYHRIKTAR